MIPDLTVRTRLGAVDLVPFLRRDEGKQAELRDWERRPAVIALNERGWLPERIVNATGLRLADVHDVLAGRDPKPAPKPKRSSSEIRAVRMAERVLVNGLWTHPRAPHGETTGYTHWGCRCLLCGDAQSLYKAMAKRAFDERRAAFA